MTHLWPYLSIFTVTILRREAIKLYTWSLIVESTTSRTVFSAVLVTMETCSGDELVHQITSKPGWWWAMSKPSSSVRRVFGKTGASAKDAPRISVFKRSSSRLCVQKMVSRSSTLQSQGMWMWIVRKTYRVRITGRTITLAWGLVLSSSPWQLVLIVLSLLSFCISRSALSPSPHPITQDTS